MASTPAFLYSLHKALSCASAEVASGQRACMSLAHTLPSRNRLRFTVSLHFTLVPSPCHLPHWVLPFLGSSLPSAFSLLSHLSRWLLPSVYLLCVCCTSSLPQGPRVFHRPPLPANACRSQNLSLDANDSILCCGFRGPWTELHTPWIRAPSCDLLTELTDLNPESSEGEGKGQEEREIQCLVVLEPGCSRPLPTPASAPCGAVSPVSPWEAWGPDKGRELVLVGHQRCQWQSGRWWPGRIAECHSAGAGSLGIPEPACFQRSGPIKVEGWGVVRLAGGPPRPGLWVWSRCRGIEGAEKSFEQEMALWLPGHSAHADKGYQDEGRVRSGRPGSQGQSSALSHAAVMEREAFQNMDYQAHQ